MSNLNSTLEPPRRLLFGPGPTQVHPRVYEAMGKPIVGHLDPFFFEVYEEIRRDLRPVFGTQNIVRPSDSPAQAAPAWKPCLSNFVEPGQKLAAFTAGYSSPSVWSRWGRAATVQLFVCSSASPGAKLSPRRKPSDFLGREKPPCCCVRRTPPKPSTGARQ